MSGDPRPDPPRPQLRVVYAARKAVPRPVWRALTGPYWWWYNRARHQAAGLVDGRLRQSRRRLEGMRDLHRGERCFILGNGPSLKQTDLRLLKGEVTFGLNRIYLLFPELGFATNYLVAINTLVTEQCAQDIRALNLPKFITWRARNHLRGDPEVVFLDTDYTGPATFSTRATGRLFEGSTVTYVALQLAFHLGFEQVILVGVDHRFQTQGQPNVPVVSQGEDPDHFSPDYFGKGFRWQLPDLAASEQAYGLAREGFEAAGRRVQDATVGGALTVFPKVRYQDLF
jgi:hypothetical protein